MLTTINDCFFHVLLRDRIDSEICALRTRLFRGQSTNPIDPYTAMILNDNIMSFNTRLHSHSNSNRTAYSYIFF